MFYLIKAERMPHKYIRRTGGPKDYQYFYQLPSYPSVLSPEEERSLALKYKNDRDVNARNKLIEHNQKFVAKIAGEYAGKIRGISYEDLLQEGNLGLFRAIEKYDPDKGRLTTYADAWIRANIRKFIEEWIAQRKAEVGEETRTEEGEKTSIFDITPAKGPTPEAELQEKQRNRAIQIAMEKLNDNEKFVIENRFMAANPLKLDEVGKRLGVSMQRAKQIEDEAVAKMKKEMKLRLKTMLV